MTTTEKDYVSDITALIERFLDPFAAFAGRFCQTKEELPAFTAPPQRRFFNFSNPNTTGSGSLEAVTRITKAFTSIIDYMKVYAIYCANFLPATKELKAHAQLVDAFRLSQLDDNNEPPFDVSDLIKPVQRICRYSLLLRSLVKNATSEEEEDLAQQALESMQRVSDIVNARVRDAENNVRLLSLNDSIDNSKLAAKMQLLRPGLRSVPRTARQYIVHCETEEKKKEFVKLLRDAISCNIRSPEPRRSYVSVAATNLSAKLWQSMKFKNFSHTVAMRLLHRGTSTTSLDCQDQEINGSTDESNSEEPHSERLLRSSRLATSEAA
eukprot:jgi/Phyca11/16533/fgenesh1_pg.PHYCAscaffold_20_\